MPDEKRLVYYRLDSLADISGGIALGGISPSGSSVELPYLRVANVQDGYISTRNVKKIFIPMRLVERFRLMPGDVLLTEGGDIDKLGRGAVWDGRIDPCLHQNHVFRVRCLEAKLLAEFLALYMASPEGKGYFLRIAKQTTNLASISSSQLSAMPIPCPPVAEQRRIVEMVSAVSRQERVVKASIAKLQNLKKGAITDLLKADSGKVSAGSNGDPKANDHAIDRAEGWPIRRLIDVADLPVGQVDPRSEPYRSRILLAPDHVEPGTGKILKRETAEGQGASSGKYEIQPGDVVFSKIRPALRKVALVDFIGICSADMYPLRPGKDILSGFLFSTLLGEHFSRYAENVSGRTGIPKVNREDLAGFFLPLPPIKEQQRVVEIVDSFSDQERSLDRELAKLGNFKQGIVDELLSSRVSF
ncbi:restriction endonuclease subunit S [Nonomuraea sp. K274]|uniref:Restriction endonuclease subunit S n=1 Tax=Nonomuraea cypriaca TaxID=1187855 RepID=A0A931A4R3_9ACTN|nr:restriction endonuclease subunit S [Nonomuraea cypriaca]MBF8186266.1 restriction endonuclease subunit S [Nonomuraea cypriaca]